MWRIDEWEIGRRGRSTKRKRKLRPNRCNRVTGTKHRQTEVVQHENAKDSSVAEVASLSASYLQRPSNCGSAV